MFNFFPLGKDHYYLLS